MHPLLHHRPPSCFALLHFGSLLLASPPPFVLLSKRRRTEIDNYLTSHLLCVQTIHILMLPSQRIYNVLASVPSKYHVGIYSTKQHPTNTQAIITHHFQQPVSQCSDNIIMLLSYHVSVFLDHSYPKNRAALDGKALKRVTPRPLKKTERP
jgi:hypothetical protein